MTDDFDWSIGNNGTSSSTTGPSVDNTYGTQLGRYAFIEASRWVYCFMTLMFERFTAIVFTLLTRLCLIPATRLG